ncbi:hypothetical protein [Photorhabdus thracensis]
MSLGALHFLLQFAFGWDNFYALHHRVLLGALFSARTV